MVIIKLILTGISIAKFFFSDKAKLRRAKKELKNRVKQDLKVTKKRLKEIRKEMLYAQKTNNKSAYLRLSRERKRLWEDFQKRNK